MMDRRLIERIERAVLYEGHTLYPYRASALKNAKRWTFGTLYPEKWAGGAERAEFQTEFLFEGAAEISATVLARFILGEEEREVRFETTIGEARRRDSPEFALAFSSTPVAAGIYRLRVALRNRVGDARDREEAERRALGSAHAVVSVDGGGLVSMTDPPPALANAASQCVNTGVWPVLIGPSGARDTMLASPIILPDYPEIAPESAGDLCDATEIEEILTLRILTLTDAEKAEVRASGARARAILEQAESLPAEHLMKLHGTIRGMAPATPERWSDWDNWANAAVAESIEVHGVRVKTGDRVRLRPSRRADILDSALAGRVAVVDGIEQDFENRTHIAVVVEDDPGRDLGELRQTGHRFFFSPEEVEPLP